VQFGRGFIATFLCVYVVMIGAPIARTSIDTTTQNAAPVAQTDGASVTKQQPKPLVDQTATPQKVKVTAGTEPGTLRIDFPAGTKPLDVAAAVGAFGLTMVSGDAKTGSYVFSLPKIDVYIESGKADGNDRAWLRFPSIYTEDDIGTYFGKRNLKEGSVSKDPDTGDRTVVVEHPRYAARLNDRESGL
jgi:hypothetical protein